jgi:hypothetical protein
MQAHKWILGLVVMSLLLALAAVPTLAQGGGNPLIISGWMLNRLYGEPGNAHFEMERISLSASKQVDSDIQAYVEYYYHHWVNRNVALASPWFLESAYVDYTDKQGNHLRVGKGRNYCFGMVPTYGNRKTSEYGLIAETFTQERTVGLQYFGSTADKKVDFGVSAFNALPLGTRFSGTDQAVFRGDPFVAHLADKGEGNNLSGSARVAVQLVEGAKLGASYRAGKLRPSDISFLVGKDLVLAGTTDDTNHRWGLDFSYKHPSGAVVQGEYYDAKASTLDFKGWDALVGYETPNDPKGLRLYARYGKLNLDPPAATANPYTWDQKQLILSAVKPLRAGKPVWLQLEYIKNDEDPPPGVSDVDNDVLFLELFTGF